MSVYVINADYCDLFRDWEHIGDVDSIMAEAERQGSLGDGIPNAGVFTNWDFADRINNEELYLSNSFIFIK
jgi:hypothetical protein